jgi:hypothetical protein
MSANTPSAKALPRHGQATAALPARSRALLVVQHFNVLTLLTFFNDESPLLSSGLPHTSTAASKTDNPPHPSRQAADTKPQPKPPICGYSRLFAVITAFLQLSGSD